MRALINYGVGDPLPMNLTPQGVFERQSVQSIRYTSEGVVLETEHRRYVFDSPLTAVTFPIRTDVEDRQVVVNWCLREEAPYPYQLAVGDIVDPHGAAMHPRQTEPEWPAMGSLERMGVLQEYWEELKAANAFQVITALTPISKRAAETWQENGVVIHTGQHRYLASMSGVFQQPFTALTKRDRLGGASMREDEYPRSGQYTNKFTNARAWFAVNPSGRGLYPAFVQRYDRVGDGLMAPPRRKDFPRAKGTSATPYADEWNVWTLVDGDPHPMDPRRVK